MTTTTRPATSKEVVGSPLRLPDGVAELAHAALAARTAEHPARERNDLGPGVGGTTGRPDGSEAGGVVDVVPDVRDLAERRARRRLLLEHGELVVDAVHALGAELRRPRPDDRVRLGRDDQVRDVDLVEAAQPGARRSASKRTDSSPRSLTQTRLSVKTPSKSKTRAGPREQRPSSVTSVAAEDGRLAGRDDVVERDRVLLEERTREDAAEEAVELVRRQPAVGGRLRDEVAGGEDVAGGESRAATSFLPIFCSGLLLARGGRLTPSPSASGTRRRSRTSFRIPSGISENAWSVPFHAWLSVKCFSITRRRACRRRAPSRCRSGGRRGRRRVREALAQRVDHAQVQILDLGRVGGRALQEQSCGLSGGTASTARSTSSIVAPPVETIIGLPNAAT